MTEIVHGSPGGHPHSDRPNWSPAETADDYIRNCQEGLETYSDRRMAKLLGVSRAHLWRMKSMAAIPEELFNEILSKSNHTPSAKELASVGRALAGRKIELEIESCPHCGGELRTRRPWRDSTAKIVDEWLAAKRHKAAG